MMSSGTNKILAGTFWVNKCWLFVLCVLVLPCANGFSDECRDILDKGIRDEYRIGSDSDVESKVKEFFSRTWEENQSKKASSGGGGSLEIFDVAKAGGEGHSEEEIFNQMKSHYEQNKDNYFHSKDFFEFQSSVVNPSVVQAWSDCMSGKRITAWFTSATPNEVILTIHYVPKNGSDPPQVTIGQVLVPSNLEPIGNVELKSGFVLKKFGYVSQPYHLANKDACTIVVNVEENDQVIIPIRSSSLPPPPNFVDLNISPRELIPDMPGYTYSSDNGRVIHPITPPYAKGGLCRFQGAAWADVRRSENGFDVVVVYWAAGNETVDGTPDGMINAWSGLISTKIASLNDPDVQSIQLDSAASDKIVAFLPLGKR